MNPNATKTNQKHSPFRVGAKLQTTSFCGGYRLLIITSVFLIFISSCNLLNFNRNYCKRHNNPKANEYFVCNNDYDILYRVSKFSPIINDSIIKILLQPTFKINIPKKLKSIDSDPSFYIFNYSNNQKICFYERIYGDDKRFQYQKSKIFNYENDLFKDTIFVPDTNYLKDYKEIMYSEHADKLNFTKNRKSLVIQREYILIFLLNIKEENFEDFYKNAIQIDFLDWTGDIEYLKSLEKKGTHKIYYPILHNQKK